MDHRAAGPSPIRVAVAAALALAFLAGGCAASGHRPTASVPASSAKPAATAGGTAGTSAASKLQSFSACMRAHGVPNFPDLTGTPHISEKAGQLVIDGQVLDVKSSVFQAANTACRKAIVPATLTAHQSALVRKKLLQFSACMRAHGFPNFPDLTFKNGKISLPAGTSLKNAPGMAQADQACQKAVTAPAAAGAG